MNLYGQAHLGKQIEDQKNVESNYWRIFRELEEAKKTIANLEAENKKLRESAKVTKSKKRASKKSANTEPIVIP